jgi:hypothetical protein
VTLGEEGFLQTQTIFFPECLGHALGEEFFLKKMKPFPRVLHSGKWIFQKNKAGGTDGVNSSPSARTALGEGFPECAILDTRRRPLSRERHPRRLFPECCTRGRLPRVFLPLPRVHLALGGASVSCSVGR